MDTMLVSSLRVDPSMNSNASLIKPDFSDLKVFSVDQGGSQQIGIGGTEISGLMRGPAYQSFDSSGNLSLTGSY
jgi:hypothetical protein